MTALPAPSPLRPLFLSLFHLPLLSRSRSFPPFSLFFPSLSLISLSLSLSGPSPSADIQRLSLCLFRDAPAPVYVDLETSQTSRDDSEELYESLMDYQSVKTISNKGVTLRVGTGHSLDIGGALLGIAAADNAARRQLAKAKKNLGATKRLEKGANTGSPMLSFWLKEIARLERQLATSSQSQRQPPAVMATVHKMAGEKLGITLSDRNLIKIVKTDSPCARTGAILVGDEIIGVNGVSVEGNRDECLRLLKEAGPKIEFRLRRRSPPDSASPPPIAKPGAPAVPTAHPAIFLPNKAEIATLDVAGVGALLAKLKLDSHIGIFEENVITGKVFLGLDDDTLMSDLAVVSQASFGQFVQLF